MYTNDGDVNESIWVVVDSDGEEESPGNSPQTLCESDIIALLNQIPFSALFKKVFSYIGLFFNEMHVYYF